MDCENDEYDLDIDLGLTLEGKTPQQLGLLFGYRDARNHYVLETENGRLRLIAQEGANRQILMEHDGWKVDKNCTILVRRRRHYIQISVDEWASGDVFDARFSKGKVALLLTGGVPTNVRCQPYAAIAFDDDFMRTEEEQQLSPWSHVSGNWRFHSVKEKHSGTAATHSANPFSLGGSPKSDEGRPAIVTAGHSFWADYEFQVSLKSHQAEGGLICGYRSEKDFYRVEWKLIGHQRRPRRFRLVKFEGGRLSVLAEGFANSGAEQWYRLVARLRGRRIQILLDESLVFDVLEPHVVRGKVGLCNLGPGEIVFDDVLVRENVFYDFSHAEALAAQTHVVSGHWNIHPVTRSSNVKGNTHQSVLVPGFPGRHEISFGAPNWAGFTFSFDIRALRPGNCALKVGPRRLFEFRIGKPGLDSLTNDRWNNIRLDLTEPGEALLYLNDYLHDRLLLPKPIEGAPAISIQNSSFVQRPEIRNVKVAFERQDDWEQPTKNQLFVNDPFMKHWAAPEGAWNPVGSDGTKFWHKGDFFGKFDLNLPAKNGIRLHFSLDQPIEGTPDSRRGYTIAMEVSATSRKAAVTLSRLGRVVMNTTLPAPDPLSPPALRVFKDGRWIWIRQGKEEILSYRDDAPLPGTAMAIESQEALAAKDFRAMNLRRNHVRDETFERAFTDWVRIGTWEVTNRFSCTPTWSHLIGRSRGDAYLWNKNEYEGDLSLEYYIGIRMRQSAEEHDNVLGSYPRNGDFNASFNCEGFDPNSGYTYLLAAWDPHWSERWSYLLRKGKRVLRTDRYLVPRTREGQSRPAVAWLAEGRPVHGAWYYVKIRRRGNRLEYYYDNRLVKELCFTDPHPPSGKQLAIWTLDNSIVIARAKVAYSKRSVPHRLVTVTGDKQPPVRPEPGLNVFSDTHPGLDCNFEGSFCGWKSTGSDQGAVLLLDASQPSQGRWSLKLVNSSLGGDFGATIPILKTNARKVVDFSFDYRINLDSRVNFYLTLGGRKYFIHFTGETRSDENLKRLGEFSNVVTDGKWRRASFKLAEAVLKEFESGGEVALTSLAVGNQHEGYLRAGLGGNPEGAAFYIDRFRIVSSAPAGEATFSWTAEDGSTLKGYSYSLDDQPSTEPEAKVTTAETSVTCKAAGAGFKFFHLRGLNANGKWTGTVHLSVYFQAPMKISLKKPASGSWGGEPIIIDIQPKAGTPLNPNELLLTVNRQQLASDQYSAACDSEQKTLSLDLSSMPLTCENGAKVHFALSFDPFGGPHPKNLEGAKTVPASFEWTLVMNHKLDKTPPRKVALLTYSKMQDFEGKNTGSWQATTYSRVSLDDSMAAAGKKSLKVFKPIVLGTFAADALANSFLPNPLDTGKTPILSFDYRLSSNIPIDLAIHTAALGWWRQVYFAGGDLSYKVIGKTPNVVRDGKWHHAELDLRKVLSSERLHPNMFHLSGLQFGDYGSANIGKAYHYHIDNFGFVPTASAARGVALKWRANDPSGIQDFSYHWSPGESDEADTKPEGPATEQIFKKLPEGPLYFHIRARDRAGNWGHTAHYKYLIDNTPPAAALKSSGPEAKQVELSVTDNQVVDVATLKLKVNGKEFSLNYWSHATFEQSVGKLQWDWQGATGLGAGKIANGFVYQFQLPLLADHAGNISKPLSWNWKVDYSKDKVPPPAPAIKQDGNAVYLYGSFTRNTETWRNWAGQNGSTVSRVLDPARNDYCMQAVDDMTSGSGGVMINPKAYDTEKYPWIAFEYKIPAAAKIHFMIHINGVWRGVTLTVGSTYPAYTNIGNASITPDNTWRSTSFNLLEILKKAMPEAKSYSVNHLAIADYHGAFSPAGTPYFIDNFAVIGASPVRPTFTFSSYDSSGIERFRYLVNGQAVSTTEKGTVVESSKVVLTALKPGFHYLHVSASDGAGNWGPPSHHPIWIPAASQVKN